MTERLASEVLRRQLQTAWALADLHLDGLTTEECLWRPAAAGMHVAQDASGTWVADWPEREDYVVGPPSIAWTTWHVGFWWSMVLTDGRLTREEIPWPGTADAVRAWLAGLHERWRSLLASLDDAALRSPDHAKWPFTDRPFADVAAWVNVELTKNAAEIGYGRFLYAVRDR